MPIPNPRPFDPMLANEQGCDGLLIPKVRVGDGLRVPSVRVGDGLRVPSVRVGDGRRVRVRG